MNTIDLTQLDTQDSAVGIVTSPADYHASKDKFSHCISKSTLADFAVNPWKWRYNKLNGIKKSSAGYRFGSLLDTIALTPEQLHKLYLIEEKILGTNKDGSPSKIKQDPAQLARWNAFEASGGTIITKAEYEEANRAASIFSNHLRDEYGLVLGQTFRSQVAMYRRLRVDYNVGKATPIILTGMIDILPDDDTMPIFDLKTTSTSVDDHRLLDRDLIKYKYGWQAAIYTDLYESIYGVRRPFSLLFVESSAPYVISEVRFDFDALDHYREQYWLAIKQYASCVATDYWPGAVLAPRHHEIPKWA